MRPAASTIYQRLLAASMRGGRKKARERDEVVADEDDVPLFRIRPQQNTFAVLLPRTNVSPHCLDEVKRALSSLLQRERSQEYAQTNGRVLELRQRATEERVCAAAHTCSSDICSKSDVRIIVGAMVLTRIAVSASSFRVRRRVGTDQVDFHDVPEFRDAGSAMPGVADARIQSGVVYCSTPFEVKYQPPAN